MHHKQRSCINILVQKLVIKSKSYGTVKQRILNDGFRDQVTDWPGNCILSYCSNRQWKFLPAQFVFRNFIYQGATKSLPEYGLSFCRSPNTASHGRIFIVDVDGSY